jgi:phosphopantothenate synthetase
LQEVIISVLIQINSISAIPYFIKIYQNLKPELKEKVENFVKNGSNNKIFYYILPYAKTKDI